MSNTAPANASRPSGRLYTNTLLTLMAGFVLAMMLDRGQGSLMSVADAQHASQPATSGDDSGLVSAAEQRKVMIAELRSLNSRMEHMEAVLAKPMSVKVIDMPPIQMRDGGEKDKKDDRKSEKKVQ